ncbi:MAG: putative porin [Bacteroidota bacterium]
MIRALSILSFSCFFLLPFIVSAQFPSIPSSFGSSRSGGASQSEFIPPPDSVSLLYLDYGDFRFKEEDSLTIDNFQKFDPVLLSEFDHLNLGNVGSPHKYLVYQPRIRKGFDLGMHQYDLYFYRKADNRYFNNSNPYSDLYYTAGSQENAVITALFSQNLSKSANIVFDYRKINHRGGYSEQRVRHTNLTLNGWFRTKGDKYLAFWSWNNNLIKNQNNGGIQADSFLLDSRYLTRRDLIPVNLTSAQTEFTDNELAFGQYFQFHKKSTLPPPPPPDTSAFISSPDTTTIISGSPGFGSNPTPTPFFQADRKMPPLRLAAAAAHHEMSFQDMVYKFFDDAPAEDASYYGNFQTNQRGIRHFFRVRKLENTVGARIELGKLNDDSDKSPFEIQPALTHKIFFVNQEPITYTINNLLVSATVGIRTKNDGLDLSFYGHYGLAENIGDLALTGQLGIDFGKIGRLEAGLIQQRYNPSMIEQRLFVSQEEVWSNDFAKTNELNISAYFIQPKLNLKVGIQNHLIDNLVWYNENAVPEQADAVVNVLQIIAEHQFKFWKFNLHNKVVYQQAGNNFIRLPEFWSRHSFYFETRLFKVMETQMGVDVSYNTNYMADAYFPLTGQFHQQNTEVLEFIPRGDAFLIFKVKTFRFSLKGENISQMIFGSTKSQSPLYPTRDFMIRFGIGWRFFD